MWVNRSMALSSVMAVLDLDIDRTIIYVDNHYQATFPMTYEECDEMIAWISDKLNYGGL